VIYGQYTRVTFLDSSTTPGNYTFATSNADVILINQNNGFTVYNGTSTITAYYDNGGNSGFTNGSAIAVFTVYGSDDLK
jgi:hypothetical protein